MNRVVLTGRLTKDPDARFTQSGIPVTTFTLAVDRRFRRDAENSGQPTADFIPIVTWRGLAEVCANNLTKGRLVAIEGRMQVRSYDAQDGSKRYVTEVIADNMEFLGSRNDVAQGGGNYPSGGYSGGNSYGGGNNYQSGYSGGGSYNNAPPATPASPAATGASASEQNNAFGPPIPDEEIPF